MNINPINGDSIEVLKTLPDNSVDTVITDPPYGLGEIRDIGGLVTAWACGDDGMEYVGKGGFMGKSWDACVPPPTLWKEVYRVMKPGATALVFAGSRTMDLMTLSLRMAGFEIRDCMSWMYGTGFAHGLNLSKAMDKSAGVERETFTENIPITVPATDDAKAWDGWGTSLKPAYEPIIIAMKPLEGTFVENAKKWGVAGYWIDGGRIGSSNPKNEDPMNPDSRFPANVLLDEVSADILDKQSGITKSTGGTNTSGENVYFNNYSDVAPQGAKEPIKNSGGLGDVGGASRFFYVAKPTRNERDMGLENFEKKVAGVGALRDNGRESQPRQNFHPTVKPVTLMRYLARLTKTPTGGVVLDPFMGSGTTGIGAVMEGRSFIGIEKESEYYEIAKTRIEYAKNLPPDEDTDPSNVLKDHKKATFKPLF